VTDIGDRRRTSLPVHSAAAAGTITLGRDLKVNRMAYGAMRITGPGIFGPPADRDECIRVLRRAVELEVNFIDTADSYGPHVSEELIAEALYPYPPGLIIATKGGLDRPGPDQWVPNGRPEHLRAALHGSLERLRVDRIDLWQLHRIDPKVPEDEQFGVLAEFVRDGLVRHIGLSEVDVDVIERARTSLPIVSVQNQYNVIDRRWDDVVEHCERHGLAFIPWFPLGAGSLTRDRSKTREAIDRIARRHEATPMQVALAWLLARSPAMLVIPGTSKVKHVEENIAAASIELSEEDVESLA
jgi:Predicted oxidoreductases (related to aryl-alcohol dehydrogenases)